MGYIKGFLALFVLMTLLIYLVPGESFKKYIRFFSEIILALGFLSPVLSFICDSDEFLQMIEYEEFAESLNEISRDTQKLEFLQNDYYIGEYEQAIGEDVSRIAEQYAFTVRDVDVHLTEEYTIDSIYLSITNREEGEIVIGKIGAKEEADGAGKEYIYAGLKKELSEYYQMEEAKIEIQYDGIG